MAVLAAAGALRSAAHDLLTLLSVAIGDTPLLLADAIGWTMKPPRRRAAARGRYLG